MRLLLVFVLLFSAMNTWALDIELGRKITDGRMIYYLLHRPIDNLQNPYCIKEDFAKRYEDEIKAFLLAGCKIESVIARKAGITNPSGKSYLTMEFLTHCPNERRRATDGFLIRNCVLE